MLRHLLYNFLSSFAPAYHLRFGGIFPSRLDLGVKAGIVEKSGSWFSYNSERIGQGRENAKNFLTENPELRERLLRATFLPGEKLNEVALAAELALSRTPLREALKVLATDGLVNLEPNRGAWVSRITVEELDELFPVMGALEALIVQSLAHMDGLYPR